MAASMREMLEAGCHFGHQTRFWSPKMAPYIYGHRNKIHIINLEHTVTHLKEATTFAQRLSANRGKILFLCAKRQAKEIIAEEAIRCGMPFINQRWLGGMLTNFKTVKASIKRLKDMQIAAEDGSLEAMTKKEALLFRREMNKLESAIGGIKEMGGLPDALFVVDIGFHKIAIAEAGKLGIPVIGVVDTNHAPIGVDYIIPGNDDSARAIRLYARSIADAILTGKDQNISALVEAIKGDDEFVEVSDETSNE